MPVGAETVLIFKLLLTPTLIGLVSLTGRRWGPAVSGWLVGLPLTSGPVTLFLALDHGTAFASHAAQGTLLGLISLAAYCLTYSWLSTCSGWPVSLLSAWLAFFALTFALDQVSVPLLLSLAGAIGSFVLVLRFLPGSQNLDRVAKAPRWEIPLRMIVATTFVIGLTGVAGLLGPQLSGLLAPFPVYITILAVFSHHFYGANTARLVLRGLATGIFSFAIFFLVVALLIVPWGIAGAFVLATLAALLMHSISLLLMRSHRQRESTVEK